MKDDRTFRQRMQEADRLVREAREQSEDEALIQKIRMTLEPSVEERTRRLLSPDVEGDLRERMHLRPRTTATRIPDDSSLETELRKRMHLERRNP